MAPQGGVGSAFEWVLGGLLMTACEQSWTETFR